MILSAHDEIELIDHMADWKPWEVDKENIAKEDELAHQFDFAFPDDYKLPDIKVTIQRQRKKRDEQCLN